MSRIFDLIAQLESEIDRSPRPKLANGNKRVVDCDRLLDIIGDIKVTIPDEVRVAQNVYAERQNIISAAEEEAAAMLALARKECEKLISKENVLAEARKRAQGIVARAEQNSDMLADGARNYTDEILTDLQRYLREYIGIIEKNRMELHEVYSPSPQDGDDLDIPEAIKAAVTIQQSQNGAQQQPSTPGNGQAAGAQQGEQGRPQDSGADDNPDERKQEKKSWFSRIMARDELPEDLDGTIIDEETDFFG